MKNLFPTSVIWKKLGKRFNIQTKSHQLPNKK